MASPAGSTVRSVRSVTGGASAPAAAAVTISSGDLMRMRRLADDEFKTKEGAHEGETRLRAQRKEASKARADRWPNTLVAMRHRKDQARVDAVAAKEAAMIAEDEASQQVREGERLRMIAAAEDLVRQQSDKYKILANYRQLSYDMDVMKQQAEIKAQLAGERRRQEEAWTARILDDLARATEEETQKLEQARAKARAFARERNEQLNTIIQRRIAEIRETEEAGRRMVAQTQAMEAEAAAQALTRREESTRKLKEFAAENERLKSVRAELKRGEGEMVAWIAAQAAAKEEQDGKIKAIIARQREEAAKKAQVISGIVSRSTVWGCVWVGDAQRTVQSSSHTRSPPFSPLPFPPPLRWSATSCPARTTRTRGLPRSSTRRLPRLLPRRRRSARPRPRCARPSTLRSRR
jgi:hypothetical protein